MRFDPEFGGMKVLIANPRIRLNIPPPPAAAPTPAQECRPIEDVVNALIADATSFDVDDDYSYFVD